MKKDKNEAGNESILRFSAFEMIPDAVNPVPTTIDDCNMRRRKSSQLQNKFLRLLI